MLKKGSGIRYKIRISIRQQLIRKGISLIINFPIDFTKFQFSDGPHEYKGKETKVQKRP